MSFDPLSGNPARESNYFSQPFVATGQPNSFPSRPPAKDLDFDAAGFLPFGGGGVYFVEPHLRTPYIYQYNLSVQRELGRATVLEVAYAGSDSHKLTGLYDSNPFVLGTTSRVFNRQPGVSASSFSYLDTFANVGTANYNGLILGLSRRLTEAKFLGLVQYQISYTHGRSIDTTSGFRTRASRVSYYNRKQFRAVSDYDLPHNFVASGTWELPFANLWHSGPGRLTRGWTLYPIVSYRSGLPLDVLSGISRTRTRPGPSGAGDPNLVRANLVAPITYYDPHLAQTFKGKTGNFYFDPAAFSSDAFSAAGFDPVNNPSQRTYGTLGRNAFRGPNRTNLDLSIAKNTNITGERVRTELRADFFNLFNHAQFANPSTSITAGTFGQISTTADPRIIQVALRLTF